MNKKESKIPSIISDMFSGEEDIHITVGEEVEDVLTKSMYMSDGDAARELINNEARQCRTAMRLGHKAHINITIDVMAMSLNIKGVGSMGMTMKTLKEVYSVFGKTGNKNDRDTGMFGIGRFSYLRLSEVMQVQTISRETGEKYGFIINGKRAICPLELSMLSITDYGFESFLAMKSTVKIDEMITHIKNICRFLGVEIYLRVIGAGNIQSENQQIGPIGVRDMLDLKENDRYVEIKEENFEIFLSDNAEKQETLLVGMPINSDILGIKKTNVLNVLNEKKYPPTANRAAFNKSSMDMLATDMRRSLEKYYSKFDFENMDTDEIRFHDNIGVIGSNGVTASKMWSKMVHECRVIDQKVWMERYDGRSGTDLSPYAKKMKFYEAKESYTSICYTSNGNWNDLTRHFEKHRDVAVILLDKKSSSKLPKSVLSLKEFDDEVTRSSGDLGANKITCYTHNGSAWSRITKYPASIKRTLVGLEDDRTVAQWKTKLAARYDDVAFVPRKSIPTGSGIRMLDEHVGDLDETRYQTSHSEMGVSEILSERKLVFIRDLEKTDKVFGEIAADGVIVFAQEDTDILIAAALARTSDMVKYEVVQYDATQYGEEKSRYAKSEDKTDLGVDTGVRQVQNILETNDTAQEDVTSSDNTAGKLQPLYDALNNCDDDVDEDLAVLVGDDYSLERAVSKILADDMTSKARIRAILEMDEFEGKTAIEKVRLALADRVDNPEVTAEKDGSMKIMFARKSFKIMNNDPMLMIGDYGIKSLSSKDGKTVLVIG